MTFLLNFFISFALALTSAFAQDPLVVASAPDLLPSGKVRLPPQFWEKYATYDSHVRDLLDMIKLELECKVGDAAKINSNIQKINNKYFPRLKNHMLKLDSTNTEEADLSPITSDMTALESAFASATAANIAQGLANIQQLRASMKRGVETVALKHIIVEKQALSSDKDSAGAEGEGKEGVRMLLGFLA